MRKFILPAAAIAGFLVLGSCMFCVDRAEYVYVTQFGQHVATLDGTSDGGLHWKLPWPIQTIQRLDNRLQCFDLSETEFLTHDRDTVDRTLTVTAYVCWRIADAQHVDWFLRRIGQPDRVHAIVGERIRGELGAELGRMNMDRLISTDAAQVEEGFRQLRDRLLRDDSISKQTKAEYGIELVDVRIRRLNHPAGVRDAIFERIRSERETKAADYRSEGDKQAREIKSLAERKARELVAEARADEVRRKGLADAEADRIRNEAQAQDPEFYAFLKKLEEYQRILGDNRSVLLLSTHRELFDLLLHPPRPGDKPNGMAGKEAKP